MRYVTVRKFASESGYTEDAIRSKIRDGIWRLGEIWIKAPDQKLLILEAFLNKKSGVGPTDAVIFRDVSDRFRRLSGRKRSG